MNNLVIPISSDDVFHPTIINHMMGSGWKNRPSEEWFGTGGSPFDPVNHNYPSDGSLYTAGNFNELGSDISGTGPYDNAYAYVDASGQTAHGGHCPRHCSEPSFEAYDGTNPDACTKWTYDTGVMYNDYTGSILVRIN